MVYLVSPGRRIWSFPNFTGDCATRVSKGGNARELEEEATDSCSSMMQQLHNLCYYKKVKNAILLITTLRIKDSNIFELSFIISYTYIYILIVLVLIYRLK